MTPTVHYHIDLRSRDMGRGPSMTCITSHEDALKFGQSYVENMASHYNACGRTAAEDTRAEWTSKTNGETTIFRVEYPDDNGWDEAEVRVCHEPMIDMRDSEAVSKLMDELFLEGKIPQAVIRAA